MAAPEYVPVSPTENPRVYASPPRLEEPWPADRPGELARTGQPDGPLLGAQGPDLGYALKLAERMRERVVLAEGEHIDDVVAGCTAVAMKRSAMFGRAPIMHDLTVAFGIWGYLDEAPAELVELRRPLFAEVSNYYHWAERRRIVDLTPESVLARPHTEVSVANWTELDLDADTAA